MPRPRKCRKVCQLPKNNLLLPALTGDNQTPIVLALDEYEAIRLIDREGFSQAECGAYMHIARATVQQIYTSAREKLATALVEGRPIQITGGDYRLCDGQERHCNCGGCRRHRCGTTSENQGGITMKIAIPLDENKQDVCPVLARAPYFLFWEAGVETIVENPAAQAQGGAGMQVAQFLLDRDITVLITPRCGQNAADVFTAAQLQIFKSIPGTGADNLSAFRSDTLQPLTHFHGGFHGIQ